MILGAAGGAGEQPLEILQRVMHEINARCCAMEVRPSIRATAEPPLWLREDGPPGPLPRGIAGMEHHNRHIHRHRLQDLQGSRGKIDGTYRGRAVHQFHDMGGEAGRAIFGGHVFGYTAAPDPLPRACPGDAGTHHSVIASASRVPVSVPAHGHD